MVVPATTSRDSVLELMQHKENIERNINEQGQILRANKIGMDDPLVDGSGFPRNDIDVYQVRQARHRIICLQNDLKALMKQIESGLHRVHAESADQQRENLASTKLQAMDIEDGTSSSGAIPSPRLATLRPIAKVNVVSEGSPAQEAGIALRDEIVEFGTINSNNFKDLSQIAMVVRSCENKTVLVKVRREGRLLELVLTPKSWTGRGLLGCNIVPLDSIER
ncbi:26S proteasome non-ATPase regulatory subunit 9-like [Uranotaenia lowii]|uniref:26S proteasome non-ATPase regulatory subunit 9-like n=1 Tax=Uranotaenia lowii TaxID=190385 RepID=UPI00247B1A05|nr:26S proteasome non-ATPase regulatory subunit 9-like [Uranotaenia lowii]XP_055605818.1 26S proteasome non-ATPase regulatory subunit 9-like [Uranotaenia lowii]